MNKRRRQELKQLKYIKRIKLYIQGIDIYFSREDETFYKPKVVDVVADNAQYAYKTTSTPCSCWMCSGYYKYRRHLKKIEDRKLIQEGLDENGG